MVPDQEVRSVPVLLSKVNNFNRFKKKNPYHLSFYAKGGLLLKNSYIVELLEHKLPLLFQEYKNPITLYFWGGTCDITKKQGKFIDILASQEISLQLS